MRLPSVRTFDATFRQCSSTFEARCLGPAKRPFQERLTKAFVRSKAQFSKVCKGGPSADTVEGCTG